MAPADSALVYIRYNNQFLFLQAAKAEFASVILWDTVTWQQICTLEGHNLTVTQIVFSHSGEYLLTVSRDRTWFLYKRKGAGAPDTGFYIRLFEKKIATAL